MTLRLLLFISMVAPFGWLPVNVSDVVAAEPENALTAEADFFESKVRPLLVERCADCHDGSAGAESELAIDSRQSLLTGGSFGPAIVPGKPTESLLFQAVRRTHKELRMPPDEGDDFTKDEVAIIGRWIEQGAVWPASEQATSSSTPEVDRESETVTTEHWSFLPRTRPALPNVAESSWAASPIDRFIHAKHLEKQVQPVDLADRRTLLRRANFDLIGLPPAKAEVDAFLADKAPDEQAFAKIVDRLLASRHYGERWGRHWLDVARYADTQGDVGDVPIPQAYLYRNWVIDAFNQDMPYDEFIQAQLAGDIMAGKVEDPERARQLATATGFIALSRRFGNQKDEAMHLTIEDSIDTISRGIMGVTLKCARCHDHKFDPMLATDYYGLYGVLASTRYPSTGMSNEKSPSDLVAVPIDDAAQQQLDNYWQTIARYEYQVNNHFRLWLKPTLGEFEKIKRQLAAAPKDEANLAQLQARRAELLNSFDGKFRELMLHGLPWLRKEVSRLATDPPSKMLYAVREGQPHDARLHRRGDPGNLGPSVPRRFLRVLDLPDGSASKTGSGRLELALWLTSADHPLTARTIVNRVWHHHFGRGLVATTSNFGVQGSAPSHPELLDYLADSLIAKQWSLKQLHREIMLSRTYRLSSAVEADSLVGDPENIFFWRHSRRRLDAESIRDSMLLASGELDRAVGGRHPFPAWHKKRYSLNGPFMDKYPTNKRSIYLMTSRLSKHPYLELFDGPDTNETTGMRASSSVPAQSLYLMNSSWVAKRAAALSDRVISSSPARPDRIDSIYKLSFAREATKIERQLADEFLDAFSHQTEQNDQADRQAWTAFARAILTSNEFFFID